VISAIDGAITEPSYRAGALRDRAIAEMNALETALRESEEDALPSIAIGQLGPPRLSKLLIEAWLICAALGTCDFDAMIATDPAAMRRGVEAWLQAHPNVGSLIATIGIGVLREDQGNPVLTRGPKLNIPVPTADGSPVPLGPEAIERYAEIGWVDLRAANFEHWRARLEKLVASRPDIVSNGSAAFDESRYLPREFVPGDVVGWVLTNETDEIGLPGHRIL
jgi:hypothetical protein